MATFTFMCLGCEAEQEWSGSLADKPEDLLCSVCGGKAIQSIAMPQVIIRREQQTTTTEKMKQCIIDVAVAKAGMRKDREMARDRAYVEDMRNRVHEEKRGCHQKTGKPRILASLPAGYVQAQNILHGKGHMNEMGRGDLKKKLKGDGLWLGED